MQTEAANETANPHPRTELDSHAKNMVVLGKNCFVFDNVEGRTCDVTPFDPSIGTSTQVPIVDAAIVYDCPFTLESHLLIVRNGLYLPNLSDNLIPPFILSEAGVKVDTIPKIHSKDPTIDNHSLYFADADLRIPLKLNGIFSYFHSRAPNNDEIRGLDPLFLTPDSASWDPYSDHYSKNEDAMLDWEGNIMEPRFRKKQMLELHEPEELHDISSMTVTIGSVEASVDTILGEAFKACYIDGRYNNDINAARLNYEDFGKALSEKVEEGKFAMVCR